MNADASEEEEKEELLKYGHTLYKHVSDHVEIEKESYKGK